MVALKGESGRRKRILVGVGALALIGFALALRGEKAEHRTAAAERPAIVARVVTVATTQIPDEVTASGTVRPVIESKIAPKIMSNVSAVYVREGDRVRRGQVLIRLESRDLQAQVLQANAALSAALAGSQRASTAVELQQAQTSTGLASAIAALKAANEQLSLVKEGARRQEKAQANLAVMQAQAQYKNAEIELDRMKMLYQQGAVPKQRLDGAETSYEVAKAQYEAAKEQADLVSEGSRRQEIRAAEERVRQAEEAVRMARAAGLQNKMSRRDAQVAASQASQARAAVSFARVQLGYSTITSPVSGVVTARYVDPGDTVSPGVPVIAVEDDSLYRLEATVASSDVEDLYLGKQVTVTLGTDERRGVGRVSVISPSGDPGSRKFLVKVDLPKRLRARSGDFGRVSFPRRYSRGIVLDERAVRDQGGLTAVFLVDERGRARMQVVKTGRRLDGGIEVISGLSAGDRVIIDSTGVLADGVRVRLRET